MLSKTSIDVRFNLKRSGFSLNVDVSIPGQGVTVIFGHSGSGKTSLLRCIAGLEKSPQGYLSVHGAVWQEGKRVIPTHKRPLGYVFQEASLFDHLTAQGNLNYAIKRSSDTVTSNEVEHIISLLGLSKVLDRFPSQLSGGERQRVAIARALLVKPKLLLMDEPLASLDVARKQEILPYLESLKQALNIPIIYVSHSPDEVARLADHIVALDQGNVVANGPMNEILSDLNFPLRLGEDTGVVLEGDVVERDTQWHLMRVQFGADKGTLNPVNSSLWVRDSGCALDKPVRVRILARDVSLALEHHENTSILNVLPGSVVEIASDVDDGMDLVKIDVGSTIILARISKRSVTHLELVANKQVWVQIKSAALVQ